MAKNKLAELLEIELLELRAGFKRASLEGRGTPQEVADRREGVMRDFFTQYFPFPFRVVKGQIADSYGKESASIDCLVLDSSHPYTVDSKTKLTSVIMADGVDYAVEVKGDLKSQGEIERVLKQMYSVKKLQRVRTAALLNDKKYIEWFQKVPCIIYADETYEDYSLLIKYAVEYYKKHKIKRLYQFDLLVLKDKVIVNDCVFFNKDYKNIWYIFESKDKTLAVMLYFMSKMPLVQPRMNGDIINIYLDKILDGIPCKTFKDYNKILTDIENEE